MKSLNTLVGSGVVLVGMALGCSNEAAKHWSNLEQCMIGERLGANENVLARLRSVQVAQVAVAGATDGWPNRCADSAKRLHDALDASGKDGMVKRSLGEQLGCNPTCAFPAEGLPLPKADELWQRARAADFTPSAPEGVVAPNKALKLLLAADLPVLAPDGARLTDFRSAANGELWLLLTRGKDKPLFCSVPSGDASAKCQTLDKAPAFLADAVPSLARDGDRPVILGTAEQGPVAFDVQDGNTLPAVGEKGQERTTGLAFAPRPGKEQAPTSKEEAMATPTSFDFDVFRVEAGKASARGKLTLKTVVREPLVVKDWLVYVDRDKAQGPRFSARQAVAGKAVLSKTGSDFSGTWPGPLSLCSSPNGAAIASFTRPLRGFGKANKTEMNPLEVTVLSDGKWSKPLLTAVPKTAFQTGPWECGDGWGGIAWAEYTAGSLSVVNLRCSGGACEQTSGDVPLVGLRAVHGLAQVGPKTLIVYSSGMGETSLRLAPLKELATAPSVALFDNENYGGLTPTDGRVLSQGDGALFVFNYQGLRALRVKSSGEVAAVTTK